MANPFNTINPFNVTAPNPPTPFASTGLGITLNTITGLPSAAIGVAKDIGQGIARSAASAGLTLAKPFGGGDQLAQSDIQSLFGQELFKNFFGTEPVKAIENNIADAELAIKNNSFAQKIGADKFALPLAFGGVFGGDVLNLTPFGGLEKNATKQLVKETTTEGALSVLKSMNVPEDVATKFAPHFAEATTPQEVQNVFDIMKGTLGVKAKVELPVKPSITPESAPTAPITPKDTIALYRASPTLPTEGNFTKGTYFADSEQKARYYSESHLPVGASPDTIKVQQFTLPKDSVFREPSTGNYTLKGDVPVTPKVGTPQEIAFEASPEGRADAQHVAELVMQRPVENEPVFIKSAIHALEDAPNPTPEMSRRLEILKIRLEDATGVAPELRPLAQEAQKIDYNTQYNIDYAKKYGIRKLEHGEIVKKGDVGYVQPGAKEFTPTEGIKYDANQMHPIYRKIAPQDVEPFYLRQRQIPKGMESLVTEAEKYKSAEEYVNSNTGINSKIEVGNGIKYAGKYPGESVYYRFPSGGGIEFQVTDNAVVIRGVGNDNNVGKGEATKTIKSLIEYAQQAGKDVAVTGVSNQSYWQKLGFKNLSNDSTFGYEVKNSNIKSQLTDFYNKVKATPQELRIPKTELSPPKSVPQKINVSLPPSIAETSNPVNKLIQAIKEAKPIRSQQEKLYSEARSQRVARVAAMQGKTTGEKGFYAELSQLKGELPKVNYESIRKVFSQQEADSLFNMIKNSPRLDIFEQITGRGALVKMLSGTVPTTGELKILNQVFPKELIDTLLAQRPFMTRFWEGMVNALNIPRSILSSFDLSAPLRQGVFLVGRKEFYKAFVGMFKQFGSEKAFQAVAEEITSRPTFKLMKRSHLALTEMDRFLTDREEKFMSNWAEKIPLIGIGIKASQRAYVGFLNKLRADTFDSLIKLGKEAGIDMKDDQRLHDLAKFINSATGRGDLGSLNKAAPALNAFFFSPRLMASRLNMLNPVYYVKLDPFVRKQAIKSLLSFAGIAGTVLGLAKMGGAIVSADSTNADFGKVKVGNTRFDILGGFQQYIRLTSQLIAGKITSSTTGKTFELGKGYKPLTRKDILIRFFQGKENPVASFVTDFLQGQDAIGNPFKLSAELINRFVPLIAQDLQDAVKEWGTKGLLTGIPATFGVGVQTYGGPKTSPKKQTTGNPFNR